MTKIRLEDTGQRATIHVSRNVAKFVSVYNPRPSIAGSTYPHGDKSAVSFPHDLLPEGFRTAIPCRSTRLATAHTWRRVEVLCNDVDALVQELARYDARNLSRDRFLEDQGFNVSMGLSHYATTASGEEREGYVLILQYLEVFF